MAESLPTAERAPAFSWSSLWILSSWRDLLLFVGTPVLIIPAILSAQARFEPEDIYLFVASFGALGHHLPGMMRAYGDRALFRRFRTRFIVSPLFLVVVCLLFSTREMSGVMLVVYLWGVWHGLMQTYGFLRIYDAKVGSVDPWTGRLDHWMCLAWFGSAVLLSPTRSWKVLNLFYDSGGPLVPGLAFQLARQAALVVLIAVTAAFLVHLARRYRAGSPPSPIKLILMVTSFGFWWYANVAVENVLVGIALFEVFHDVQYLSIVWIYNRSRAEKDPQAGGFTRFLFRRGGALIGLYVGLVFAYGSLNFVAQETSLDTLRRVLLGVLTASTLLHFYFDGFIWKVREKTNRESLGIEGGQAVEPGAPRALPSWVTHGAKWALFVAPVLWLGYAELRTGERNLPRAEALAAALPDLADAQYNLGVALGKDGKAEAARAAYGRALELNPELGDAHFNLANLLQEEGKLEEAEASYRRSLDLEEKAQTRLNLGNNLLAQGRREEAIEEYRRVVEGDPQSVDGRLNLGNALVAAGRLGEAESVYREAIELRPDFAQGHYNLGLLLETQGRGSEALSAYRRALEADGDFAEAHFNLGNLLAQGGLGSEAVDHLRQAVRLAPSAAGHYNLGNLLAGQRDYPAAIAQYEEALAMAPDLAEAHHNLGAVLLALGRTREAVDELQRALILEPSYADAHHNLATALERMGRQEEAERHREQARALMAGG